MLHTGIEYQSKCEALSGIYWQQSRVKWMCNEYLIECPTKVKWNVWQIWTWMYNDYEINVWQYVWQTWN